MMLATDPVIVRFPANVDDIARASQPACGSGKPDTTVRSSITAGTLLTTLQTTAVAGTKNAMRCRFQAEIGSSKVAVSPARSAPPTMMNRPRKNTSRPQSTSSYTLRGSIVRVISSSAAPTAATSAGGTPVRNPTITSASATTGFLRSRGS